MISYREKRQEWLESLSGEDENSIRISLSYMARSLGMYKVINETRKYAEKDVNGEIILYDRLHNFIDDHFYRSHLMMIRAMVDTYPLGGKKGVYSLVGLLDDIIKCNCDECLLTRKNIFIGEELEYDYEAMDNEQLSLELNIKIANSKSRHISIDKLSGVDKNSRSPCDAIHNIHFERILEWLTDITSDIKIVVDKFIAHNAIPMSRENKDADNIKLVYGKIFEINAAFCKVAAFISGEVLGDYWGVYFPTPQIDILKNSELPFARKEIHNELYSVWYEFEREHKGYSHWGHDEYAAQFGVK